MLGKNIDARRVGILLYTRDRGCFMESIREERWAAALRALAWAINAVLAATLTALV